MARGKLTPADFRKRARAGSLAPVYAAIGGELLLHDAVEHAARAIPDEPTRDFNLDILHGDGLDARELAPALSALPVMAERRVVLVKHAEAITPTVQKYVSEYANDPVESTLLVLLIGTDGKQAWVKKLAAAADVIDCGTPRRPALAKWARRTAEQLGVGIDEDALALLTDTGGRLIDLYGELLKASLLIDEGETITLEVLQRVWGIREEVNVWSFFDHVAAGDRLTALKELEVLQDNIDKDSGFFFSQIARRWRLAAKERGYDRRRVPPSERRWSGNTKRQWQMASAAVRALPFLFTDRQLERLLVHDRTRKTRTLDPMIGFANLIHRISLDRKDVNNG